MGAGIAQVTIDKGMKTILKDMNDAGISRGINQIQTGVDAKVQIFTILHFVQKKFPNAFI
jgi:enoyl-CoA hydratase/long-chain 3-hydroxyacyl-CoA dehydrogenase